MTTTQTWRHFKALMHKNWIIYKRNPFSAICYVITPIFLMMIMVWLRTLITPSPIDSQNLLLLSHPIYTIATADDQLDPLKTTQQLEDFFLFNNYTDIFDVGYDVLYDFQSPAYFYPSNCGRDASFVKDETESTIIAFVGQNNSVSQAVQNYLKTLFSYQGVLGVGLQPIFQVYESKEDLFNYISSESYLNPDPGVCFGFEIDQTQQSNWAVNLYFDDQRLYGGASAASIPRQTQPVWSSAENKPLLKPYKQYSLDGYSFMQNIIANMLLREVTQIPTATINMMAVPMQSENLVIDRFALLWGRGIYADLVLLLYVLPIYNLVFFIVKEKEHKAKESMRMMGLGDLPYWLSWLTYYTILNTVTALLAWLVLYINVFNYSQQIYIFLFMWLYGQSLFGQVILIQSLFSKSKYAGIVATVVYFVLCFANIPVLSSTAPFAAKFFVCIIPQANLYQMAWWICSFEGVGQGINHSNLWDIYGNYSAGEGYLLFIIGFFFFLLIGLYLDAVIPTEYGSQRHPCFLCQRNTYFCCRKRQNINLDETQEDLIQDSVKSVENQIFNDDLEVKNLIPDNYEPVSIEIARQEAEGKYLKIENLKKTYDNGFEAVKGINLKMYQNQIFALLGQNGAGKSTTISMLTGLIQSTQGKANVFNVDMFKQGDQVRSFMGVCPQHDILFEYLTPIEHLSIFYDFKGGDPLKKQQEIIDLIRDVGLEEDQNKPAGSLSGGNRRKLSVAIAMCGGSKLVLLDEPTAGMDLGARRSLWDMLKNYRNNKIIILTTHYMDEADVLGDRIGIMARGQLMCLGSSLFLKKRFGAGYKLTMVKAQKEKNELILPYIQQNLGPAELISEVSSEISFGVQEDVAHKFQEFFKIFDSEMVKLGIISYGISITTLEEVFLHINQEFGLELLSAGTEETKLLQTESKDNKNDGNKSVIEVEEDPYMENSQIKPGRLNESLRDSQLNNSMSSSKARFSKITTEIEDGPIGYLPTERLISESSIFEQVAALLTKRFNVYKRDRAGLVCEVIVPFIMVLVGCSITKINLTKESTPRLLTPSLYPSPQRILLNKDNVINSGIGDISPETLFLNLPESSQMFEVNYIENATFDQFYQDTFDARLTGSKLPYRYGSYQIYKADNVSMQYSVNSFVNLTSQDVTALFPQFMYQSILQTASGNPQFSFQVTTVPFPTINVLKEKQSEGNAFVYSFMIGIGISLIPCAMISFILKEREDNLKHMQLISGMSLQAYWLSNMIADIIKVYIPIILIILLSLVFNQNYQGVWVLFMLLPLALVPFTYITSFLFKDDTNGQILTLFMHFFVCVIMANTVYLLQLIPETFLIADRLRWWFCIFPTYCLMNGLLWSSQGQQILQVREQQPDVYTQLSINLWAFSNLGGDVVFLILHFFLDSFILFLIENETFNCIKKFFRTKIPESNQITEVDSDVLAEEERVGNCQNEVVRVYRFRKAYKRQFSEPFLAVDNITFGLDFGECFALLGVNGAGKSTTFKSLTAAIVPSSGEIEIQGFNTIKQFDQVRKLIGYCPQHDAIFPLMTVEEHLWFYSKLKGISQEKRQKVIENAIEQLNLADHRLKPAGTLSGGNKRKLSVALAILGNPPIILLDEPSAGMDPEARRFMWQVVANISQRDKKSAVIITTHSMEEAEALSTKMGIMVRGGIFRCYGSAQHIKSKFGTGYEIDIKIKKPTLEEISQLQQKLGFLEELEDRVDIDNAKIRAEVRGINPIIIQQIKTLGLGSDLALEAQQSNNLVRVKNFIQYLYTLSAGLKVIQFLCKHFIKVELYEQCGDFFKMRIPNDGQTIGKMFGIIQDYKIELNISEYSISQTSLEQIFQTFANQSSNSKKTVYKFCIDSLSEEFILQQ